MIGKEKEIMESRLFQTRSKTRNTQPNPSEMENFSKYLNAYYRLLLKPQGMAAEAKEKVDKDKKQDENNQPGQNP